MGAPPEPSPVAPTHLAIRVNTTHTWVSQRDRRRGTDCVCLVLLGLSYTQGQVPETLLAPAGMAGLVQTVAVRAGHRHCAGPTSGVQRPALSSGPWRGPGGLQAEHAASRLRQGLRLTLPAKQNPYITGRSPLSLL